MSQLEATAQGVIGLRPTEDAVLTVTECFQNFNEFCLENGLEPITRRIFKPLTVFFSIRRAMRSWICGLKIRLGDDTALRVPRRM